MNRMKISMCVFAAMLLLVAESFAATDLDKPIEPTRPTLRTEIYRGTIADRQRGALRGYESGLRERGANDGRMGREAESALMSR
jgi:hypothetical protein